MQSWSEIGHIIFDRSKKPITTKPEVGAKIVAQAKNIVNEANVQDIVEPRKRVYRGSLP